MADIPNACDKSGCNRINTKPRPKRAPNGAPARWLHEALRASAEGCLVWPYAKSRNGYGNVSIAGSWVGPHIWVCIKAHGEKPFEGAEVAHGCGNPLCCNPKHLRWATSTENKMDRHQHGTVPLGESVGTAKLSEDDVRAIRELHASGMSMPKISKRFPVTAAAILKVVHRRTWKHVD